MSARVLQVEDNEADARLTREALREGGDGVRLSTVSRRRAGDGLPAARGTATRTPARPTSCCSTSTSRARAGSRCSRRCAPTRRCAPIPVIVLTSSSAERDVIACYERGANAFVVKPQELDDFMDLIGLIRRFWLDTARLPSGGAMTGIRRRPRWSASAGGRGRGLAASRAGSAGPGRRRSRLQRAILDSLQDGVVVYDEDERIVFFNPAAQEILGRAARGDAERRADLGAAGGGRLADPRGGAPGGDDGAHAARPASTSTSACGAATAASAGRRSPPARCRRRRARTAATRWWWRSPTSPSAARPRRRWSAPTPSWPSSPTSPRTTSASRCGWSPPTCSCCAAATTARSTRTRTSSSTSRSRARTGCGR